MKVAWEFSIHFQSMTSSLGLFRLPDSFESLNEQDPINFPDPLNLEKITPIHKKKDLFDRDNYRPINILPLILEVCWKHYIQPSLQLHPAVLKSIAIRIHTGSRYSACFFPIATGMAKATWWIRLYWYISNGFIKSLWLNYCKIDAYNFDNISFWN